MGTPIVDFNNATNWEQIWFGVAEPILLPTRMMPWYPPIIIPINLTSPTIAIWCKATGAKPSWKFGGTVEARIQTRIAADISYSQIASPRKLSLNKSTLIRWEKLAPEYSIVIHPAQWLEDFQFLVAEYNGIDSNTLDELAETIKIDVLRTESKVNVIANYGRY